MFKYMIKTIYLILIRQGPHALYRFDAVRGRNHGQDEAARIPRQSKHALGASPGDLHLEQIRAGSYLLYRRPTHRSSGNWSARVCGPDARRQRQDRMGPAGDFAAADGIGDLSYKQAADEAELWFKPRNRCAILAAEGDMAPEEPYSVAEAFRDCLHDAKRRGMKGL